MVGSLVGCIDGWLLGCTEGCNDGSILGWLLGILVGNAEGVGIFIKIWPDVPPMTAMLVECSPMENRAWLYFSAAVVSLYQLYPLFVV